MTKTAREIGAIMDALDCQQVERHFAQADDDDEVEPYMICDGVSVAAFNEYIGDGEGLRIGLRFLELISIGTGNGGAEGRLVIVDLSTAVHESTAHEFESKFLRAAGNDDKIGKGGSMTAENDGHAKKEADASFGPMRTTPHRTPPPANRVIGDWLTLAVEVGRYQTWASLQRAAQWWCNYAGIQYVLLLKINATATEMRYALYHVMELGILPAAPTASGMFHHTAGAAPVQITFDMHRILSIPADQALPDGVNPTAVVDLRMVMNQVCCSI